ncbi:MAG: phosphate ABC transporter substrate-binding protein PstS [Deltaproteobacteria bacterium]
MKTWIAILASSTALFAVSCKKGEDKGTPKMTEGSDKGAMKPEPSGPVSLSASGSTFQKAFEEIAMDSFMKSHPDIKLTYGGGGSGKGRQDLADMVVDFAGSDSKYKDEDKAKIKGGDVLYFPILLGGITVSYNVQGADNLNLSPDTVAKIFQGDIKKWNDPAIVADNKGAKLPAEAIVVVHRADGSGTTDNFTKYLDTASGGAWKLESGSTVDWPKDTQAGQGNGGVAQIVSSTKGAIGYVDLSDAKAAKLHYANIKNKNGKFVEPTADSASAAGDGIDVKDDLTFSALDAKGDAAYPITYQSWVIVYAKQADPKKGAALKQYLSYLIGDAQKELPGLDFAPLPKSLQDKAVAQLAKIQ